MDGHRRFDDRHAGFAGRGGFRTGVTDIGRSIRVDLVEHPDFRQCDFLVRIHHILRDKQVMGQQLLLRFPRFGRGRAGALRRVVHRADRQIGFAVWYFFQSQAVFPAGLESQTGSRQEEGEGRFGIGGLPDASRGEPLGQT